ncbi:MAG: hypothetical protein HOL66_01550 [Rhodospirillaceae bacterium]|jgi:LmbE family N-acetylglucosaminyl deacetylase|nr:hypothetical protein [Rhodospirillaceae bacterium]MBT5242910.1 hypothetical protein [Rhodospirillaceae bacterium]MBT5563134.1 hypothetical protein [Rhodospirillaceae bacterium]MBT6243449.1 hypothetical protein [Rhodospirillaceae bacterium]MBT7138295.1 hypothetical protein [Rhodospirillaceae bacterium]
MDYKMKVLAIGAHADDVELGCGGSLLKWAREGHEIFIYVVTESGYAKHDGTVIRATETALTEARISAERIGANLVQGDFKTFGLEPGNALNSAILAVIEDIHPDLVVTHWDGDSHTDHRAIGVSSLHACRHVPSILMYASNLYHGTTAFDGRICVDIGDTLEDKLDLLAIFESEFKRTDGKWRDQVHHQAALAGLSWNVSHAETFQVVRHLL